MGDANEDDEIDDVVVVVVVIAGDAAIVAWRRSIEDNDDADAGLVGVEVMAELTRAGERNMDDDELKTECDC